MKRILLVSLCLLSGLVYSGEVKVAVAANFTQAAKGIANAFYEQTNDTAILSFGSTGKLYAQIANGAPFEVFLAADVVRPEKAIEAGYAIAGSGFTYAKGKIVLYSAKSDLVDEQGAILQSSESMNKVAIANPKTAPYGNAAVETMKALNVYSSLESKIVQGDSIAQTYQFVATRAADVGFVAYSQVINSDVGSMWVVPESLYPAIRQNAVLLNIGANSETANAFIAFLKSETARKIIESYGYGLD